MRTLLAFLLMLPALAQTPLVGPIAGGGGGGASVSLTGGTGISVSPDPITGTGVITNTAPGASPAGSAGACQFYATSSTFGGNAAICLGSLTALSTPTVPVITHSGTAGAATWGYQAVARNLVGQTLPSTEGQTTTGNATLTGMNFNIVTTVAVTGSTSCDVYRVTSGGTPADTGWIGNVACGAALNDTALTAYRFLNVFPALGSITNTTVGEYIGGSLTVSKNARFGASADPEEPGQFNVGASPTTLSSASMLGQTLAHANFYYGGSSTYAGVQVVQDTNDSGGDALNVVGLSSGTGFPTATFSVAGNSGAMNQNTASAVIGAITVLSTGNLTNGWMFHAVDGQVISSGALTNQGGLVCDDLTIGTTLNACIYSSVTSGSGKWSILTGTAAAKFGGTVETVGNITIASGSPIGSAAAAVCWKTTTTLSYCESVVGAGGTCTCH